MGSEMCIRDSIDSLRTIEHDGLGNLWVGAAVHLDEFADHSLSDPFPSVKQVIQGISSVQLQSQGTLVGEILRRPTCWYFRDGHGLLAERGRLVMEGDNRYHAILGTALSPDGSLVAYVVREPLMEEEQSEYRSHIWVAATDRDDPHLVVSRT